MPNSRAEYFKERRKSQNLAQFNVTLKKEKLDALTDKLNEKNVTKREWLEGKIDETLQRD